MDQETCAIHGELFALRFATAALWANFLRANSADPLETCGDLAQQMHEAVSASNAEARPGKDDLMHEVLQKLDLLWKIVASQLQQQ